MDALYIIMAILMILRPERVEEDMLSSLMDTKMASSMSTGVGVMSTTNIISRGM